MKKIFLLFTLLFLTSTAFGQNEFKMYYPTITINDDTLSVITMKNRYYFAAIKAPDSLYSITEVKFSVGNHSDSLALLTDGGSILTYTPVANMWLSVEPIKFFPYKIVQPSFDALDSNFVGDGWKVIARKY